MVILLMLLLLSSSLKVKADELQSVAPIGLLGCQTSCGNVSIPFPFGIGSNCFLDPWYEIQCRPYPHPNSSIRPFLPKLGVEVLQIVLDVMWVKVGGVEVEGLEANFWSRFQIQNLMVSIHPLKVCTTDTQRIRLSCIDLRGGPYNFSTDGHVFLLEGCAGSAVLVNQNKATMAGCSTICHNNNNTAISGNKCYGVECCQTQLPSTNPTQGPAYSPLQFFHMDFYGQSSGEHPNCLAATLMNNDSLNEYIGNSLTSNPSPVPIVLLWSWVSSSWPHYNPDQARCSRDQGTNITSTTCECNSNRYGNPYVFDGCQVPDGCKHCDQCVRNGKFYVCEGSTSMTYITSLTVIVLTMSIIAAIGTLLLVFGCCWLRRFIKKRSKTARRIKVFKSRLQQHQSTNEGVVERTKLFTHKHLDKATNHFNENRVLGKGGQGIVYKGMLDDGRTVAIKKLKMIDESEMEQFINEVVILSQINHRNVVKLLGCCLEKEVPLIVYEFISNGTLSQHIHDPDEDFILSWPMRLKIAADAAGAIAYLHSYSSIPIYHRDIKSSNILLDEKYKAKVSDFGSSKTTSIDQTHLTTLVRGTWGYLDPEYFQSNQFTDKSDVYSFGVVLLELLTGKKPIYRNIESMEQKSLVIEFLLTVQNSQMFDILDSQVVNEAKEEELVVVANLAKRCLYDNGRMRPTMREVAMTLDMIIKSPTEMPTQDQPSFSDEEFDENVMNEMSDVGFMSSPLPASVANSLYIDVQPLLHDTI